MRLLLDTHTLIWYTSADPKLSAAALAAISHPANDVAVSAASLWEVGIKAAKGALELDMSFPDFVLTAITLPGFAYLGVNPDHVIDLLSLPFHHKDPFDRMLVAQTRAEGMTLVTRDDKIALYDVPRLW